MEEFSNLGYWIFSSLSECAGLQRGLEREISFLGQNIFGFWSLCHFPCLLWDPNAKTTTFSSPYPGLVLGGLTRNRLLIFPLINWASISWPIILMIMVVVAVVARLFLISSQQRCHNCIWKIEEAEGYVVVSSLLFTPRGNYQCNFIPWVLPFYKSINIPVCFEKNVDPKTKGQFPTLAVHGLLTHTGPSSCENIFKGPTTS